MIPSRYKLIGEIFDLRARLGIEYPGYIPDGYYDVPIDELIKERDHYRERLSNIPDWRDAQQPT